MKTLLQTCVIGALLATASTAQPVVSALTNNYSYIRPGLPNYGIAQGSIFDIWGTGLADSAMTSLQSPPATPLKGVTVEVTVNGTTVSAPLYYVSPTQMVAVLPSSAPAGTGQIVVKLNGQASAPAPINVVQSAFGLLTLNGAGSGPAAVLDTNYQLLSFTNSANPGQALMLWGSGLGPAPGDQDGLATNVNLADVPVTVYVGGVAVQPDYRGRSAYAGLDQINITVPQGVDGCYVSVVVDAGSNHQVSNFGTIPVVASGRTCSDQTIGFTSDQLQTLTGKGTVNFGSVSIGKSTTTTPAIVIGGITVPGTGTTTTTEAASGSFIRYTGAQFQSVAQNTASIGSCTVYTFTGNSGGTITNPFQLTYLNAGPALNISGPAGSLVANFKDGFYGATAPAGFIPASGGTFSLSNASGGPDVGPFNTSLALAAPLTWTNMNDIKTVNRSQGVQVNWENGDPTTYVQISGSSVAGTSAADAVGAFFVCTAPVSAKQFTVPAAVLLSLPPTATISEGGVTMSVGGSLSVSNYTNPTQFTASGLDIAFASAYVTNSTSVTYQ